jgi:hypothetical protein
MSSRNYSAGKYNRSNPGQTCTRLYTGDAGDEDPCGVVVEPNFLIWEWTDPPKKEFATSWWRSGLGFYAYVDPTYNVCCRDSTSMSWQTSNIPDCV